MMLAGPGHLAKGFYLIERTSASRVSRGPLRDRPVPSAVVTVVWRSLKLGLGYGGATTHIVKRKARLKGRADRKYHLAQGNAVN
jgi:hypothetical protein